ncbi:MAG: helix-turn-helix domain-containing protein, partial [Sphingobium sp.]
ATLLTETQLKVAEVGERVGYRSESAFSRRFAAYYNTTPGKMRLNCFGERTSVRKASASALTRHVSLRGLPPGTVQS